MWLVLNRVLPPFVFLYRFIPHLFKKCAYVEDNPFALMELYNLAGVKIK